MKNTQNNPLNNKGYIGTYIRDYMDLVKKNIISKKEFENLLFKYTDYNNCTYQNTQNKEYLTHFANNNVETIFNSKYFICVKEATEDNKGMCLENNDGNYFLIEYDVKNILDFN